MSSTTSSIYQVSPGRRSRELSTLSSEGVRRKVLGTVYQVERETQVFIDRYMKNASGDYGNWIRYVQNTSEKAGKGTNAMEDFKDFEPVLNKLKGDSEVTQYAEYNTIRRVIERGKMFEYISFSLKNELVACYENNLKKYCLSFEAEAGGESLVTPGIYQDKINNWSRTIEERLGHLDSLLDEYDALKTPWLKYLERYERVSELMKSVCEAMNSCGEPMKRWATADSFYARKVQDEINNYNRKKMDMRDVIKQLEDHRDELGLRLRRRAQGLVKVERLMSEARDEKRRFKRRENVIRDNLVKLDATKGQKLRDLDEVKGRIRNRKENSPAAFNYLTSMQEALRSDCRVIDGKIDMMAAQVEGLQKDQDKSQKRIDRIQEDLDNSRRNHDLALAKLQKADDDVKLVKEDVARLDGKIKALKRIREIKLHSETVRKIFTYGYRPGELAAFTDELQEAFKVTAEDMGRDWTFLYQQLPFIPPRDYRERSHDIEVIDLGNRRTDPSFKVLTIKSLEKWRRLSNTASVPTLVSTLRRIKKGQTAKKIFKTLQGGPQLQETQDQNHAIDAS